MYAHHCLAHARSTMCCIRLVAFHLISNGMQTYLSCGADGGGGGGLLHGSDPQDSICPCTTPILALDALGDRWMLSTLVTYYARTSVLCILHLISNKAGQRSGGAGQ